MQKPKAILFDLDDTLISFDGVSEQAWEKCCGDFVRAHPLQITSDTLLSVLRRVRDWYWSDSERSAAGRVNLKGARREIVKLTLEELNITDITLAYELADNYSEYRNLLVHLFPNTIDTLTKLKAAGYRLGLITNGSPQGQRAKLERFGLYPFFEVILIDLEVGYGKPDIRIYEHALKLLNLSARDVWMVGDNLSWDVQSPMSIGINAVWNDYNKSGLPAGAPVIPDKTVSDISELLPELTN